MFILISFLLQSSDDLDTDTEFEPVEDLTLETRSRCKHILLLYSNSI